MRKYLKTLIIIVVITGAAVWGFQYLRFFDRLPAAFSQTVVAATESHGEGFGQSQGGYRGGRVQENPETLQSQTLQLPERKGQRRGGNEFGGNGFGDMGQGGDHHKTASLASWVNVSAYLSIFAFFVMMTYYGELGIRTFMQRRETCVST